MARFVLIVDDEPHVSLLMQRTLKKAGFDVATAADGAEAIELMSRCFPDVVVTDLKMPIMDGRKLCETIESRFGRWPGLVVLMTARTNSDVRDWAARRPDMEFAEKPLSPRKLIERIDHRFADCAIE